MRAGQANLGARGSSTWRQKLHPFFLEASTAYRKTVKAAERLGKNARESELKEVDSSFRRELKAIREKYGETIQGTRDPLDILGPFEPAYPVDMTEEQVATGVAAIYHLLRFGEPIDITARRYGRGSFKALQKLLKTIHDYEANRLNVRRMPRFKANADHDLLFAQGIGMGVEELTPSELEACFTALCPCGGRHRAEALRKQRERFMKRLDEIAQYRASHSGSNSHHCGDPPTQG